MVRRKVGSLSLRSGCVWGPRTHGSARPRDDPAGVTSELIAGTADVAKLEDAHVDRAIAPPQLSPPHLAIQDIAPDDSARLPRQRNQQAERMPTDGDGLPLDASKFVVHVHLERPYRQHPTLDAHGHTAIIAELPRRLVSQM